MARRCFQWLLRTINANTLLCRQIRRAPFSLLNEVPPTGSHTMAQQEWQVIRTENNLHLFAANGWVEGTPSNICPCSSKLLNSLSLDPEPGTLDSFVHLTHSVSALYVSGIVQGSMNAVMTPRCPYPRQQGQGMWQTKTQSPDTNGNVTQGDEQKETAPSRNCTGSRHFYSLWYLLKPPARCQHR